MATLIFDIETAELPLDEFDEAQREYLFRPAEQHPDSPQRETLRALIQQQMSLWPLTARVVCIAMVNADSGGGQVLFLAEDSDNEKAKEEPVRFVPCVDEDQILTSFWKIARHYGNVVTFNGRGFDVPFLYLRSALLNVPISRKDWLGYRFQVQPHCDLAEQFTFYGISGREGAARRFNLDFYCKSFGITSPKAQGVSGLDVPHLLAERRFQEIAEYCLRDVWATRDLYRIWKERLAGVK